MYHYIADREAITFFKAPHVAVIVLLKRPVPKTQEFRLTKRKLLVCEYKMSDLVNLVIVKRVTY